MRERVVPTRRLPGNLADRGGDRLDRGFLADLGQHDEQACEAFFTRVEKLIDEVGLDLAVAQQQERHEVLRHLRLG